MRDCWALFRKTGLSGRFWLLLLLRSPFDALHTLLQVYLLRGCFDAMGAGDEGALMRTCLYFTLACTLLFLYNGTIWVLFTKCASRITSRLKGLTFRHIAALPLRTLENKGVGEWMTRSQSDVNAALAIVNEPLQLPHAACAIIGTLVSSAALFLIDPSVFAITMAFILPHMLIAQLIVARPMKKLGMDVQQKTAANTASLNALIVCKEVALCYNAQEFLLNHFHNSSRALMRAQMRIRIRAAIGAALLPLLAMSGYLVLLLFGADWIRNGITTFGGLTAAFQLRGGVLKGLSILLTCAARIGASTAGAKRVRETLQIQTEENAYPANGPR